jgi:hypothetical protein
MRDPFAVSPFRDIKDGSPLQLALRALRDRFGAAGDVPLVAEPTDRPKLVIDAKPATAACGHEVWLSPSSHARMADTPCVVLCLGCLEKEAGYAD